MELITGGSRGIGRAGNECQHHQRRAADIDAPKHFLNREWILDAATERIRGYVM